MSDWADFDNSTPLEDIRALHDRMMEAAHQAPVYETNWQLLNFLLLCGHVKVPARELTSWDRPKAREAERWAEVNYVNRFIHEMQVPAMPDFLWPYYDERVVPDERRND